MITEFTYTQAKAIINEIGRFEFEYYKDGKHEEHYMLTVIKPVNGEKYESYAIGTKEEADNAWEEALDNYIDECIIPELPEHFTNYFNEERWKDDAKMDGRGHSLSSYDGCEMDIADLVMFRIN